MISVQFKTLYGFCAIHLMGIKEMIYDAQLGVWNAFVQRHIMTRKK